VYYITDVYMYTTAADESIAQGGATTGFYVGTWITQWISAFSFVLVKLTFFLLYLHAFRPIRWLRIASYIGATYCVLLWGFLFFYRLIAITPKAGQPWSVVVAGPGAAVNHQLVPIVGPFDIVSDLQILVMPLLGVSKLQLSGRRKMGVMAVIGAGALAVVASCVSLYFRFGFQSQSPTQFSFYTVTLCA